MAQEEYNWRRLPRNDRKGRRAGNAALQRSSSLRQPPSPTQRLLELVGIFAPVLLQNSIRS
jgi:hypothetical protein